MDGLEARVLVCVQTAAGLSSSVLVGGRSTALFRHTLASSPWALGGELEDGSLQHAECCSHVAVLQSSLHRVISGVRRSQLLGCIVLERLACMILLCVGLRIPSTPVDEILLITSSILVSLTGDEFSKRCVGGRFPLSVEPLPKVRRGDGLTGRNSHATRLHCRWQSRDHHCDGARAVCESLRDLTRESSSSVRFRTSIHGTVAGSSSSAVNDFLDLASELSKLQGYETGFLFCTWFNLPGAICGSGGELLYCVSLCGSAAQLPYCVSIFGSSTKNCPTACLFFALQPKTALLRVYFLLFNQKLSYCVSIFFSSTKNCPTACLFFALQPKTVLLRSVTKNCPTACLFFALQPNCPTVYLLLWSPTALLCVFLRLLRLTAVMPDFLRLRSLTSLMLAFLQLCSPTPPLRVYF
ncbi:hypothetical protein J6590_043724 [Homalodisca vitripennis]|nr:hypothetical protein J6590_043724 [Homalodisca vitripennis]